jgi:hypothetical protein
VLLVKRYGDDAMLDASQRADQLLEPEHCRGHFAQVGGAPKPDQYRCQ